MSTTFTAIHVLPDGKELTAPFTARNAARARAAISGSSTDILRIEADEAMKAKYDVRAMGWSLHDDSAQTADCPWYSIAEAKELDIPLPKPEAA